MAVALRRAAVLGLVSCALLPLALAISPSTLTRPRDELTGAKLRSETEPVLTPEGAIVIKDCDAVVHAFLKISDESGYNADWLFHVMGIFDVLNYPPKQQVDEALVAGEIPMGIEPQNATVRSKAIARFCAWVGLQCQQPATVQAGSRNATIFLIALDSLLQPFKTVYPNRTAAVTACSTFLDKLVEHYDHNHIGYQFIYKCFVGFDPNLGHGNVCRYAINIFYSRINEENVKYKGVKNPKWPRYDLFKVFNAENIFVDASKKLREKELALL